MDPYYSDTKSNNEINQLHNLMTDEEFAEFTVHLQHTTQLPLSFIIDTILKNKLDSEIYLVLREKYFEDKTIDYHKEEYYLKQRAKKSAEIIRDILKTVKFNFDREQSIIDLGCGDGSISAEFKKFVKNGKVYCVDVEDWFQIYAEKPVEPGARSRSLVHNLPVELRITDGKTIPFSDDSIDVIIAFHSIHHMNEYKSMLKEINRVLKKGGYLVIKEHDCTSVNKKLILDIHHAVYEMVLKKDSPENFLKEYYANYFSLDSLKSLLEDVGLKYVSSLPTGKNYLGNYFALYSKVN